MRGVSAARLVSRCVLALSLGLLVTSQATAFEAFDGRLQAHGFYEMQLRALNADYSEDWDVTQWYNVFNLELELDLVQDTIGILDLLQAYVRAEVRYDCIYSRGCGMFRSMNTYGDRSKSLPRRLANGTSQTNSGEIPIRNEGRENSTTDPVPLADTSAFSGLSGTDGIFIIGTVVNCNPNNPNRNRPGLNCYPDGQDGIKPFDYIFERYTDFRFTEVNVKGGAGSGDPTALLGPWLPKNKVETNATLADRVNPFDSSRLNPVLNCRTFFADCLNSRNPGNGARPFRPIPVFAEDRTDDAGVPQIRIVVYDDSSVPALSDPDNPDTYRIIEVDPQRNHGDARFQANGQRRLFMTIREPLFPGDDPNNPPTRLAYDARDVQTRQGNNAPSPNANLLVPISSDFSSTSLLDPSGVVPGVSADSRVEFVNGRFVERPASAQARGLFVPSKPLREILASGKVNTNWALNLDEDDRAWNRGLAQKDEKELKEAYFDIELFDSRLWMRIGKQQIVWGKTELFRTTDQFNPQDLALATLPSLEESRIALWSARMVYSFYEVGPFEDVRVELAFNIDDYQSSDFGSCGEPYVVNLVCGANFGAFAHGFTGIGIIGVEPPKDPWQSTKGWEVGGRIEWRWDRFSFALSDFWGYADLPSVRRITTYERNVDPQTGRPLVYQGGIDPEIRRQNLHRSFAFDTDAAWTGIGNEDDPWEDQFGDLRALAAAQAATPGGVNSGNVPLARDPRTFVVRTSRTSCGTTRGNGTADQGIRFYPNPEAGLAGDLDPGADCLTEGPTRLRQEDVFIDTNPPTFVGTRQPNRDLAYLDPNDPNCGLDTTDIDGDGNTNELNPNCPYQPTNALDAHHANLTFFTWLCSATVGFLDLDRTSCAQTVFGSTEEAAAGLAVAEVIGRILGGDPLLNAALSVDTNQTCDPNQPGITCNGPLNKGSKFLPFPVPIVQLSNDPGDNDSMGCQDFATEDLPVSAQVPCGGTQVPINYLASTLSPEQEALLGCGPFWGTNCDTSGIDLLNMEPSIVLQAFAGASGTLESIRLKQQGIRPEGSFALDPTTGLPEEFRDPDEYRTDEGLQPGTLPWEVAGIGGPLCSTADFGGDFYPRGGDRIAVPTSADAARPPTRKQALPGCHRKWVDKINGYINPAWGSPLYIQDPTTGNLVVDPVSGLPLQARDGSGNVQVDYHYYSGDPDPLGVMDEPQPGAELSFPDQVRVQRYSTPGNINPLFSNNRPAVGPGHPFASRRAVAPSASGPGRPALTVPFANELAGLSWNFQVLAVAFSTEFQDALETVGDLADPNRNPCGGGQPVCGADLEGGSIPNANRNNPNTVGANRRIVAQMLFSYCGSDYGVIDSTTGLGRCRIDANVNVLPELIDLYAAPTANGGGGGINPNDMNATQAFLDTLQFTGVRLREALDATDDDDQFEDNPVATGQFTRIENEHCSFVTPQHCSTVRNLFFLAGLKRNTIEAGGNGNYGRRTMQWHSGGEITLYVPKRNVLGFAMDFAEDRTKSNFSIEATWIENVPTGDVDEFDGTRNTDLFNLTVSMDRPTFVNFLNPNRTLFINSQWFFQYRRGVKKGFNGNGPFNALATFTVFTGYFQDRLNPSITYVHDFQSVSGGLLPSINYRFSENFSATIGAAWFYGRYQRADIATNGIGPAGNQQGDWAYEFGAENGIAIARDRDEVYLRLRYTF